MFRQKIFCSIYPEDVEKNIIKAESKEKIVSLIFQMIDDENIITLYIALSNH